MAWTAAAAAGSRGARGALSAHTLLFDMPPALLGELCAVLDSCDGALGWRGLGECGPGGGGREGWRGSGAHAPSDVRPARSRTARPPGVLANPRFPRSHWERLPRPTPELPLRP
ncbi:hypothetical protein J1605_008655 [Eschrichtius robustus]|uniref:Uncharacterized protein n=1 Tax=Eschrichtius robustus TaxID=9764 RepID=A0AB34GWS1_ESCRO|nr:hypothetical protein J1605_008655 [Eschrichtius robustus]